MTEPTKTNLNDLDRLVERGATALAQSTMNPGGSLSVTQLKPLAELAMKPALEEVAGLLGKNQRLRNALNARTWEDAAQLKASDTIGYVVLTRDRDGNWNDDWDCIVYEDLDSAGLSAREAANSGNVTRVVTMIPVGPIYVFE